MRYLLSLCVLIVGSCGGCIQTLKDEGSLGFEISTRWVLIHEAKTTNSESVAEFNINPDLLDWLLSKYKEERESTATNSETDRNVGSNDSENE